MKIWEEKAVWCTVMFDLPTETKKERREASQFRKLLLDSGFSMIQYSVYSKYSPTVQSNQIIEKGIRANLPSKGEVRIFHLTDHQWASATRIIAGTETPPEKAPVQLSIF